MAEFVVTTKLDESQEALLRAINDNLVSLVNAMSGTNVSAKADPVVKEVEAEKVLEEENFESIVDTEPEKTEPEKVWKIEEVSQIALKWRNTDEQALGKITSLFPKYGIKKLGELASKPDKLTEFVADLKELGCEV